MVFKNIKPRYKKILIVVIPLSVILVVFGFLTFFSAMDLLGINKLSTGKLYDIDEYDYHLRSNATELQVSLFNDLKTLLDENTNDLAIAECVVKNYIADAYTWDNKKGQWDVGGMYYVYSPMKSNFYTQLKDQFYGLLDKYQNDNGNDGLLEVSNIEVVSSRESDSIFEIDGFQYKSFHVTCSWEYTDDSKYADIIDNKMYFRVIKNNDNRFEIVENYEG